MIYMVEMDFPHPERLAEWHEWYLAHIGVLLTVPGFRASQRFQAITATPSPYLALHEVESPDLFDSAEYRERGGPASTGEWRALHTNWRRNLLAGLDETPDVPQGKFLVVLRDARDAGFPVDAPIAWLRGVGLDGTTGECGIAIVADPAPLVEIARRDERVSVYRPISEKLRAAAC
ncbi:MAG: sugar ABC transporter [Alphaproteobacteria bacterium]